MRGVLWVLLTAAFALADSNLNRRTKLPYIADAVGNSLPPPSNVPATVGSPVNLLTPDRYEFYTFDESGELVKRLMTLEEIQAIVAAGEDTEGLVTFANDNQPTIAFNFTQPSQTKVHSVVTNVQNVLKAQMEAHKNKPNVPPTLDTPDVSDSWSLILPSIFGNTGVDIIPDKQTSGSFITPETETIEIDNLNADYDNSQSKESNEIPTNSTSVETDLMNKIPVEQFISSTSTTASPTKKTTSTLTSTIKPTITTLNLLPTITTTTTSTTSSSTTPSSLILKQTTINNISQITTSTTNSPILTTNLKTPTTDLPAVSISIDNSSNKISSSILNDNKKNFYNTITESKLNKTLEGNEEIHYEKIGTYLPISTLPHKIEKTTRKPMISTKKTTVVYENINDKLSIASSNHQLITSTMSYLDSFNKDIENKFISTSPQPVSTSKIIPSIESTSVNNSIESNTGKQDQSLIIADSDSYNIKNNSEGQTIIPLFDVAQSISQIASDLGSNFVPIPTSNSMLDTTNVNSLDVESKENLEIEIPTEASDVTESGTYNTSKPDTFVKISTFEPHDNDGSKAAAALNISNEIKNVTNTLSLNSYTSSTSPSILDPFISESMGDLLSQVVHEGPNPTSVILFENSTLTSEITINTQNPAYSTVTQESINPETVTINQDIATTVIPDFTIEAGSPADSLKEPVEDNKVNTVNKPNIDKNQHKLPSIIKNNVSEIKISPKPAAANMETENIEDNLPFRNVTKSVSPDIAENKKPIISINQTSLIKSNSSTNTNRLEPTTIAINLLSENSTSSSILSNNTTTIENSKVTNKIHKHEISEALPKVDEFKKKIQKVNIDDKELANERNSSWKLISTVIPPKIIETGKNKHKVEGFYTPESIEDKNIVLEFPKENQGLEVTTKDLGEDVLQFTELCNELAFRYWNVMIENIDRKRSIVFSPYSITSMLAMMFMGARGATSGEMNEVLKLDDMVTFNPHFTLKNISDSIETTSSSGVAISAFIRELYSERSKGKMLTFYKERAQHFYNGHVEEINFKLISDIIRRRTNLLVKRYTWGKISEYMKTNSITMNPPLAAFSANIFYTDCTGSSEDGRDGEMYFVVSPNIRQRRLVPVPAVVYKSNFLAGYDPVLDATAAALGNTNSVVSTLFLMPGQQGNVVHGDDLENLEKRILDSKSSTPLWNGLLRTLLPRVGLELQIPRFSHKSIFNVSSTLQKMGLKELFDADHADLGGLNGPSKDLYLSDMLQLTTFVTCGESAIGEQHHVEEYPEILEALRTRRTSRWLTGWDEPRDYQRAFHDPHDVGEAMHLPLHLRPRQARLPARSSQPARLKFDRPFLFFVRHNQSGMILYVGRYNPRLLP